MTIKFISFDELLTNAAKVVPQQSAIYSQLKSAGITNNADIEAVFDIQDRFNCPLFTAIISFNQRK